MKRRIHLLALIPAMIFSTGCDMKKKDSVNVIILSGQSNAVGCKNSQLLIQSMGQEKYDEYLAGYEDIQIAFNSRYFMEVFRVVNDEFIKINFNTPTTPCTITPVEGDEYLYLILPVRIL